MSTAWEWTWLSEKAKVVSWHWVGYATPAMLEVALQARNVQREEVSRIAGFWGKIRAVVAWRPR